MRKSYHLTPEERRKFKRLKPVEDVAYEFWQEVAWARGLDYETILTTLNDPCRFSALPLGHGKDWCWPIALKCPCPPETFLRELKE